MPACLPAGCVAECHMHVTHEPWLLMKGASSGLHVQGGQSIEIWLGCALQTASCRRRRLPLLCVAEGPPLLVLVLLGCCTLHPACPIQESRLAISLCQRVPSMWSQGAAAA
jgi:hypothetical protein